MTDGESLRAASTSARLVIDLEPGSRSQARTGSRAVGVCQRPESIALRLSPVTGVLGTRAGRRFARFDCRVRV
jgi:hypothetical protein